MDRSTTFVPYSLPAADTEEMRGRARTFFDLLDGRRSVRHFSDRPVEVGIIEDIVRTAATAPSGAHKQPWSFCLVSDPVTKQRIRRAAEEEEHANYQGRMPQEWLDDLAALGTDEHKPFLEIAPHLIVVFKRPYELMPDGSKRNNYYVSESVGIACGLLLAAAHNAGLATLTHTPSPMNFLARVLARPENERAFLLIPIGHPSPDCQVPRLRRKPLGEVLFRYS